jgi:hypothetical protein
MLMWLTRPLWPMELLRLLDWLGLLEWLRWWSCQCTPRRQGRRPARSLAHCHPPRHRHRHHRRHWIRRHHLLR